MWGMRVSEEEKEVDDAEKISQIMKGVKLTTPNREQIYGEPLLRHQHYPAEPKIMKKNLGIVRMKMACGWSREVMSLISDLLPQGKTCQLRSPGMMQTSFKIKPNIKSHQVTAGVHHQQTSIVANTKGKPSG